MWTGMFVLALGVSLVLAMCAMLWLGYRATVEWQRSTLMSVERRGNELLILLAAALDHDMKGAQRILLSVNEPILNLDPPHDLADRFASAFARFPYPQSFFSWKATADSDGVTYFFNRSDRPPPWGAVDRSRDPFPVVTVRDPPAVRGLVAAARARAADGATFAVFETDVAGIRYQALVHFLYEGTPARLFGLAGFTVSLPWVRDHYFDQLIAQIQRISGGQDAVGVEVLDQDGQVVTSAGPVSSGGPMYTRAFPLVFGDRGFLSALPRDHRTRSDWMLRVTIGNEPSLLAAGRGAMRTLVLLGLSSVVTSGALALILRANREAAVLAAMKAEFVASVTHEMKTPLALIELASDTLAKGRYSSVGKIEEYAKMLCVGAQQLTRLIDNVLNYARITDSKRAYSFEAVDLAELVEESLDRFHSQLTELGFDVQVRLPTDLPRISGDRAMLPHAIDNLIDNAIKHGDAGKVLVISAKAHAGRVQVEVADKGDGIGPDEVPLVFEKFYRGRGVQKRGSGLGLAIAQRIVRDHGGRITVRSTPRQGTEFEMSFPVMHA